MIEGFLRQFSEEHEIDPALSLDEAFEVFAGYCILHTFHDDPFTPNQFRMGGKGDLGIDVAAIIVNGNFFNDPATLRDYVDNNRELSVEFVVVQAKTSPEFRGSTFTTLSAHLCDVFADATLQLPCSDNIKILRACIEVINSSRGRLRKGYPTLNVSYVATGEPGAALEPLRLAAEKRLEDTKLFASVEVRAVGAAGLRDLYHRASDAVSAQFTMAKRVTLPEMPGVKQAYFGVLSAPDFVRHILTHERGHLRRVLFHDNVRDFQEFSNPVNAKIRETLKDETQRARFAVMNNGVTIVARSLNVVGDDLILRDFQVVNGCQTCYVLYIERNDLHPDTFVGVRIMETQDTDVISDIVDATNRQTQIDKNDWDARDQFHRDLEDYFITRSFDRQLYYERRSGQFGSSGAVLDSPVALGKPGKAIRRTRIVKRTHVLRAYGATFLDAAPRISRSAYVPPAPASKSRSTLELMYASAVIHYRLERMLQTNKLPTTYSPAKFHLMAAVRYRLCGGGPVPRAGAAITEMCNKILDAMWDDKRSAELVGSLTQCLVDSLKAVAPGGGFTGDVVRSQSFSEHVKRAALGA